MASVPAPAIVYTLPALQLVCHLVINDTTAGGGNQSIPQIPLPVPPNGYVPHPEIGVAYKLYNESVDWNTSIARCRSEGANLVVPDTEWKLNALLNQTESLPCVHVGISSVSGISNWVSATNGSILANLPWSSGDPSGGYPCVRANRSPRGLRNYPCNYEYPFVCEIPIAQT